MGYDRELGRGRKLLKIIRIFCLDTETREFLLLREIIQRRSGFGDVIVKALSFKAHLCWLSRKGSICYFKKRKKEKEKIRSQNLTIESVAEPYGYQNQEWAIHQRLLLDKAKLSQAHVVPHLCLPFSHLCFFSQTRFLYISMHMIEDDSFPLYHLPVQPE